MALTNSKNKLNQESMIRSQWTSKLVTAPTIGWGKNNPAREVRERHGKMLLMNNNVSVR